MICDVNGWYKMIIIITLPFNLTCLGMLSLYKRPRKTLRNLNYIWHTMQHTLAIVNDTQRKQIINTIECIYACTKYYSI